MIIPWRFSLLPFKRLLWVVAGLDQGSVHRFDHNATWLENRSLVLAWEVHCEALIPRLCGQYRVLEKVSLTFHIPDCASNGCRNLDRLYLVPTVKAAVCFDSQIQQFAHRYSF